MARAKCAEDRAGGSAASPDASACTEEKCLSLVLPGRRVGPNVYSGDVEEVEGF